MHTFENSVAIHVQGHIYVKVINLLINPKAIKSSALLRSMAMLLLDLLWLVQTYCRYLQSAISGSGLFSMFYIVVSKNLFLPVSEFSRGKWCHL